jgi:DNA adenine methylase
MSPPPLRLAAAAATRAPIKRHGGKAYLARSIAGLIPPHETYVEPFAGSAAVLFAKPPAARETIVDMDAGVVALMAALRDTPDALAARLARLDYAEAAFTAWRDADPATLPQLDLAVKTYVVANMSRGGLGKSFAWSERTRGGRPGDLNAWMTKLDMLPEMARRLAGVEVVNGDALAVLPRFLSDPASVIYADPPYVHSTRTARAAYGHEMTDAAHARLLDMLDSAAGPVLLSGYACPLYDRRLSRWRRHEAPMPNHSGQGKSKQRRVEVLWVKP